MFYCYYQNNSGGSFVVNDRLAPYVIIEANSYDESTSIAERIGIYFDGVSKGIDCDCCGDRWYRTPEISDQPEISSAGVGEFRGSGPYAHVYYLNGVKVSYLGASRGSL